MEKRVYLVDITYGLIGNSPEIRMFGVDENGEKLVILDRGFRPYFYVIPEDGFENQIAGAIGKMQNVIKTEVTERRIFGKPIKAIKVTVTIPDKVRELRDRVKSIQHVKDVLEADVRFYIRYMIDNDVKPGWLMFSNLKPMSTKIGGISNVYLTEAPPTSIDVGLMPKLDYAALDIEVYNPRGTPDPRRDPIIVIALANHKGDVKLLTLDNYKHEREMISDMVSVINEWDPDILFGYNSNKFDMPYLVNRASTLNAKLQLSKYGTPPEQSVYGHWSIIGRAHVDLYNFIEDMTNVKRKSLDYVAEYFGIMKRSERVNIPGHRIYQYWDDESKRGQLIEYAKDDVLSTLGLGKVLLPYAMQLASVSGLPLDQVGPASVGARVEWMIMHEAYKMGELAPNRVERPYESYKGAIVLEPKPGIHSNIAVIDFSSMYPNIMLKYNISPDTLVLDSSDGDYYIAPEVGYRFRKSPKGLYAMLLQKLIEARREARDEMRKHPEGSPEWVLFNERQRALKVMANAMYGYCGWLGARWYIKEVAESVTAWGRHLLKTAVNMAKERGLTVIYGDTDSLFVTYDKDKVTDIISKINEMGFEVKIDKVYSKLIFTESKKRYIGLTMDGEVDIVGFEAVRGDWSELARNVQEKVAELVLRRNVDEAVKYVKAVIDDLRNYRFTLDDVIIWKTLDKDVNEYKALQPHVIAARRLIEKGYMVNKGDTVGFVIIKNSGDKLTQRAYPYIFIDDVKAIDVDYYVEKQVIPAALRILEVFGVNEATLLGKTGRSILDYFN
ncbi:DNA polymerase domain-containing protein [Caldivirga sp.]|uniref:DNA-directed DNA polymerase n=1 Tax=Caldivirga sp. TaxID=2080243 RepID=UPI0025BE00B9|nr:DNA polymerase domain-containing protein [Caldivirga sp.]